MVSVHSLDEELNELQVALKCCIFYMSHINYYPFKELKQNLKTLQSLSWFLKYDLLYWPAHVILTIYYLWQIFYDLDDKNISIKNWRKKQSKQIDHLISVT